MKSLYLYVYFDVFCENIFGSFTILFTFSLRKRNSFEFLIVFFFVSSATSMNSHRKYIYLRNVQPIQ